MNPKEPTVDIVIPIFNEKLTLAKSVGVLINFLEQADLNWRWTITIADNASTDGTPYLAMELALDPRIRYLRLEEKGRGRALKHAWTTSRADIMCYMDVDLSTNLIHLDQLIQSVGAGFHVSIGNRLSPHAKITRSLRRELISRSYNQILKWSLKADFQDAQCGFKALSRTAVEEIVSQCQDDEWFFDTELLVRAQWRGWELSQVPVEWVEDLDSRVKIIATALKDLMGIARLVRERKH